MLLSPALLWNAAAGTLAFLAFALLLWSLFWDRSKGRLRCPRCWYDMRACDGAPPPHTCPECGRVARRPRSLKRTRRRPKTAILAACILSAALYALTAIPRVLDRGWIGAVPTTALVLIPLDHARLVHPSFPATSGKLPGRDALYEECAKRLGANEIRAPHDWVLGRAIVKDLEKRGLLRPRPSDASTHTYISILNSDDPGVMRVEMFDLGPAISAARLSADPWSRTLRRDAIAHALVRATEDVDSYEVWPSFTCCAPFEIPLTVGTYDLTVGRYSIHLAPAPCILAAQDLLAQFSRLRSHRVTCPPESMQDLANLTVFESLPFSSDAAEPLRVPDVLSLLARLSERAVTPSFGEYVDPGGVSLRHIEWFTDLCDRTAAALSRSSSVTHEVFWTLTPGGIAFGTREQLLPHIAARAYSLDPIFTAHARRHRKARIDWSAERGRLLDAMILRSAKEGWIGLGGNVTVAGCLVIVRSTPTGHARVARFLMEYAAQEREPILLEADKP